MSANPLQGTQRCDWCGFPMDTPERAHKFIHEQGECIIEHRTALFALRREHDTLMEILNSRSDVRDGPDGQPMPNEAMSILTEFEGMQAGWIKNGTSGKDGHWHGWPANPEEVQAGVPDMNSSTTEVQPTKE